MKTNKFIAVAFATLFIAAFNACTKEETPAAPEVPGVEENLVEMTLTATQHVDDPEAEPASAMVKSTFNGTQVGWEADDLVAIYDGTAKRKFTVASVENGVATLTGQVAAGSTEFYAVFPYSAAADALPTTEGQVNLNLPAVQTLAEGKNFDEDAFVTVGKVQDGNVVLKNAVSVLKLNIPEGVSSVRLQGFAYENISGGVYASSDAVAGEGAVSSITLKPSGASFEAGEHYIALLPTKFTAGYKVIYSKEGAMAVFKTTSPEDFPRKGGLNITKYTANLTWLANPIMTEADLRAYFANQDAFAGETAKLGQNITLASAWSPVTLTGMFDGQGYTVSGLNVEAADAATHGGMFSTVNVGASLKNLTVEGEISLSTSANTSYVGLVGEVKGTMYKVINKTTVTAVSTGNNRCFSGGLAGFVNTGSVVECENYGSVTLSSASCVSFVGGVVGLMSTSGLVQKSKNYGTVTSQSAKVEGLGGIIGIQQAGTVEGCVNSGSLALNAGAGNSYVGGIAGFVQNQSKAKLFVSKCTNKGSVTNFATPKAVGGICGVIHRWCMASSEINECVNEVELVASISKAEFYLGGIVGRMANPGTASAIGNYVNYITSCTNKKNISLTATATTATTALRVGGILGTALGEVNLSGNNNLAETVSMSDAGSGNLVSMVGGICGYTDTDPVESSSNINKASVIASTSVKDKEILASGILGYVRGNLISKGNINFGDVSVANGAGSTQNAYAGGIVGTLKMAQGSSASLTEDKTFGYISSSSARAGLLIGTSRYDGYGTIKAEDCVVGGKLNDPLNKYIEKEITEENFDDDDKLLISYYKTANATFSKTGLKFGKARDYDK